MVIEWKKVLCHQYDKTSKEITIMEKKMKAMKEDMKHLKMMRDKIGHNLELFGVQVDDMINKEKEVMPSRESQTDIRAQDMYDLNEQKQDGNTLIDIHQSQDQVTQEIKQICTNPQTLTESTVGQNIMAAQVIQVPDNMTGNQEILLPNQQGVIAEIHHQQLEQSNLIKHVCKLLATHKLLNNTSHQIYEDNHQQQ